MKFILKKIDFKAIEENSIFVKLLILERLIERELEEDGEETSFFARKEKNDCLFR